MSKTAISRRKFLAATTVAGLGAVLAGCASSGLEEASDGPVAETEDVRVVKTLCRGCVGHCGVLAHVKNGRVIKVEGDPDQLYSQGVMCAKGLSQVQALYNPNRVKYPMRRVGKRGENKWERISWDEALDEIAEQIVKYAQEYGPESLLVGYGGGGHPFQGSYAMRFLNVADSPNIFEPGGLQCLQPRAVIGNLMWGNGPIDITSWGLDECEDFGGTDAKAMVLWGINPCGSNLGNAGRPVNAMRARGMKTVVIDPRFTPDASKADVWLPIRPGTDLALMMCWIKYIIDNELYDEDIVYRWSTLPFLVNLDTMMLVRPEDVGMEAEDLAYVVWDRNTNAAQKMPYPYDDALDPALDGGPYEVGGLTCKPAFQLLKERCDEWTIERAAEVCWLEADMIEEAIRIYTDNSPQAGLTVGMASDHTEHSCQAGIAHIILNMIMGNVCKPGTLAQMFTSGSNPYGAACGELQHFISEGQYKKRFGITEYKAMNNRGWCHNSILLEAMLTGEPYRPHVLIECSLNKMINMPNAQKWDLAFQQLEYIVHRTLYPTSFTNYADLMLPSTEWLEIYWVGTYANRVYVRQPVVHLWEGMDEPTFFGLLAQKLAAMGHGRFPDSMDPEKCAVNENTLPPNFVKSIGNGGQIPWWSSTEEMLDMMYEQRGADMTWKELCDHVAENGWYETTSSEDYHTYETYKQLDEETGLPVGFGTPSKRLELYCDRIVTLGRTGAPLANYELEPASYEYDPLPYYHEMSESPLNPEFSEEYPLVSTSGHIPMYTHGTLRNVPWIRERHPVPQLSINPVDADKYGVEDGDWVWVESKRGRTQGKALVTTAVGPGVTHMERFWFPETANTATKGMTEMNVGMLTSDEGPFSTIIGSCTYRGFQVKVYKADGAPEGVWTEPEQFRAWVPNYDEVEETSLDEAFGGVSVD